MAQPERQSGKRPSQSPDLQGGIDIRRARQLLGLSNMYAALGSGPARDWSYLEALNVLNMLGPDQKQRLETLRGDQTINGDKRHQIEMATGTITQGSRRDNPF